VKEHPVMGLPTMNVGTFEGGSGVNLVPDLAKIGVDIRTVPARITRIASLLESSLREEK
jgi:succinyl-diaminopimelate desuccinylase